MASAAKDIPLSGPGPRSGVRGRTLDEWERVGTNKRYADSIDRQQHDRVNGMIMRRGKPSSLTEPELDSIASRSLEHPIPKR
jgi:hypothetical protein